MNKRKHAFQSGKADGGDATLVRPSNWNEDHSLGIELTNRTGGVLASGDIVALSAAADESVILDDTVDKNRKYLVAMASIADVTVGLFTDQGAWTVKVDGTTVRGNYLSKSATTKSLRDTGRAAASTAPLPGDLAIALTGIIGAGTVVGLLIGAAGSSPATFNQGASIASASTIVIPPGVFYAHVTGTTTITSLGTLAAGTLVALAFDGILQITHNATSLILQGDANWVTQAGEILWFVSEGSGNWRQVSPDHALLTYLAIGANAASTGAVRLASANGIYWRNNANTGDLEGLFINSSDQLRIGQGVTNIRMVNQVRCDLDATGRLVLPVGAGKWAT